MFLSRHWLFFLTRYHHLITRSMVDTRTEARPFFPQIPGDGIGMSLGIHSVLKLYSYPQQLPFKLTVNVISLLTGSFGCLLRSLGIFRFIDLMPFKIPSIASSEISMDLLLFFALRRLMNLLFSKLSFNLLCDGTKIGFLNQILIPRNESCGDTKA